MSSVLLTDVVEEFVRGIEPLLNSKKIELATHIRLSGAVRLDREKIIRAFNNIVQNAVEAMEDGGTLTFEVDQLGDEIVFGFTDTGPGVAEEIQGSLFQSFVTLGKGQGTGLGLIKKPRFGYVEYGIDRGDRILFFTVGIIEQQNPRGEMYSEARLKNRFRELIEKNDENIVDRIYDDLKAFSSKNPIDDDITLLLLEF